MPVWKSTSELGSCVGRSKFDSPQVTDHRCHVTSPGVPRVLGGEIEVFVDALIQQDADERVAAFEASS